MKIHIFDFDGVICDSNKLKTFCLKKVVEKNIGKIAAKDFEDHHKINGGISRYEKFNRLIKKYRCNEIIFEKMLRDTENLIKVKFANLEMIDQTEEVLKKFFLDNDKLYIASGGKEIEIKDLCKKWGITKYFVGIYGSPKNKIEISQNIKKKHPQRKIHFYGDSKYDYECSLKINSEFTFVSEYSDSRDWFNPKMGNEISKLKDLLKI